VRRDITLVPKRPKVFLDDDGHLPIDPLLWGAVRSYGTGVGATMAGIKHDLGHLAPPCWSLLP